MTAISNSKMKTGELWRSVGSIHFHSKLSSEKENISLNYPSRFDLPSLFIDILEVCEGITTVISCCNHFQRSTKWKKLFLMKCS